MALRDKRIPNVSISSTEENIYTNSSSEESDTECFNSEKLSIDAQNKNNSVYNSHILSKNNENFQNIKMADCLRNISQRRKNRCNSKNAINARENRLKKKLYIENLEKCVEKYRNKNKQLSLLLETQTNLLNDMKREVQYFKSIVANNKDISRLLRCINQNTGLPTTTSINLGPNIKPNRFLPNKGFSTPPSIEIPEIDSSMDIEKHPWEEANLNLNETLMPKEIFESNEENLKFTEEANFLNEEHNYTALSPESLNSEDLVGESMGVCLHISNHKLSLEFCSTCSENASTAWKTQT